MGLINQARNKLSFLIYKSFATEEEAIELGSLLTENGIQNEVHRDTEYADELFIGTVFKTPFHLKVSENDFERVNALLSVETIKNLEEAGKDHYLYEFTNDELVEILRKKDEWSEFDFELAQKILKERGIKIGAEKIEEFSSIRKEELKAGMENENQSWIITGYIFSVITGIIGVIIGTYFYTQKKTEKDGKRVYVHSETNRRHGRRMIIIGLIMFIVAVILRFSKIINLLPGL